MDTLIQPLLKLDSYQRLLNDISKNETPVFVTGVIDVQQEHLAYALSHHKNVPFVMITSSELKAKEIYENLLFFDKNVMRYPAKDIIFYNADVRSKDIVKSRFEVIDRLLRGEKFPIVLSIEALFDKLMPKERFALAIIDLKVGDSFSLNQLEEKIIFLGYERTDQVESAGQFSIRGGILDIFSPIDENPVRIEFWDDEIDSIRIIDISTQRSIEKCDSIRIFPMRELIYTKQEAEDAVGRIEKEYEQTRKAFETKGLQEEEENLRDYCGELLEKLKETYTVSGIENYMIYFLDRTVSLLDYLPKNTILFYDELNRIKSHGENVLYEFDDSIHGRITKGFMLPSQGEMLYRLDDIWHMAAEFPQVLFSTMMQNITEMKLKDTVSFAVKSAPVFPHKIDLFCDEINYLKKERYSIVILAGSQTRGERLVREMEELGVESAFLSNLDKATLVPGKVVVAKGKLRRGFEYQHINLAVFSDGELAGEDSAKRKRKKKKKGEAIRSFTDLRPGDYVVHENHGIGIYQGLEKIIVDGIHKDYMKISYSSGGNLFVPVNQMELIQKYIGSDSASPKLSKLGGTEWNKAKSKARAAVAILAEDLVQVYAKRQAAKGFVYSADNVWQKEFEEEFPYEETEDQLSAIEDVKRDMQGGKIMDRLICGDVGYGKTEVAIRAAFKAVQDGKQVAYLVPTTILAQQHYNTFCQRMMNYPVQVDLLSRFRSSKQQKETLSNLEKGFVDIVIGTHRLLSKDVKFRDLGLIIVDEEQRFGVSHKEKLKSMKENVDVLTLSATPIPRTLHMSLAGIRDMSILEEPPQERHPIQTYVMEFNDEFVRDAIHRELSRQGQVYYLYNRVGDIDKMADHIQQIVPEASVAFAHGQMTERELETIMKDFIEGEIDVLVCTTIIETGLDIRNVNTIIIQDADRMGLSQLYQLRGRVGRSNRIAYAYLMYRRNKVLEEVAEKRLQTIREFTEFGSGFKVAMRDLEIRGAGNLLGAEQHGHMESVGYEMYCKLLDEAVRELKGEKIQEDFETTMDINADAYIPSNYIRNEQQRLESYKRISSIITMEDYYDVQEEIEDRYGTLPKSVQMLLDVVLLKSEAHGMGIRSITQKQKNIILEFTPEANFNPERLLTWINESKGKILFTAGKNPYLTAKMTEQEGKQLMQYIKCLLQQLKSFEQK
ncbi:MAG: transcription-repair coupling factor [Clostridiales bacterium]|nr:transcription-repair coupling factor [Clostridiales bacterium]